DDAAPASLVAFANPGFDLAELGLELRGKNGDAVGPLLHRLRGKWLQRLADIILCGSEEIACLLADRGTQLFFRADHVGLLLAVVADRAAERRLEGLQRRLLQLGHVGLRHAERLLLFGENFAGTTF